MINAQRKKAIQDQNLLIQQLQKENQQLNIKLNQEIMGQQEANHILKMNHIDANGKLSTQLFLLQCEMIQLQQVNQQDKQQLQQQQQQLQKNNQDLQLQVQKLQQLQKDYTKLQQKNQQQLTQITQLTQDKKELDTNNQDLQDRIVSSKNKW